MEGGGLCAELHTLGGGSPTVKITTFQNYAGWGIQVCLPSVRNPAYYITYMYGYEGIIITNAHPSCSGLLKGIAHRRINDICD